MIVAVLLLYGARGCTVLAGIEEGQLRVEAPCSTVDECAVEASECRKVLACEANRCVFEDTPAGAVLAAQTPGDCATVTCDEGGKKRLIADPADIEDDGNPCTLDACDGTKPTHTIVDALPCYTGPPGTRGVGSCVAGVQRCDGGTPIGACEDEVLPDIEVCDIAGHDEDCDGEGNEEGYNCVCSPGTAIPCYTGPPTTEGVGACYGGFALCEQSGLAYGACFGQLTPAPETCDNAGIDEDCDGATNEEGDDCFCGDGFVSAGEECDDGNLDSLDSCNAICGMAVCGDGYAQPWESCDDGNTAGQDGCPETCFIPVQAVRAGLGSFTCALLASGAVKCWGLGPLGLGDPSVRGDDPNEMGAQLPAVDLGAGQLATGLSSGFSHTCALLAGGAVKCWGASPHGELGLGDTVSRGSAPNEMGDLLPAVELGTGRTTVAVTTGSYHSCALLDDGAVKCWGYNFYGQLGLGDTASRGDEAGEMGDLLPAVSLGAGRTATAIAAGAHHTCALLDDSTIKCWGHNSWGQLGLGMAQHLLAPSAPADIGPGQAAIAVSAGSHHTCALLAGGALKCWGYNVTGQLGLGDTDARGDDPGEMTSLPPIDLGAGQQVTAISAGSYHTCALLGSGAVKCWGAGPWGQLGLGVATVTGDGAGEMGDNLATVDVGSGLTSLAVSAGGEHTCALLADGRVKCWGRNIGGELGLGDNVARGDGPNEMGDDLPAVVP